MGNHQYTRPKLGGTNIISVSAVNADSERLTELIATALPGLAFGLNAIGDDITAEFVATLDGAQQATLSGVINGFVPAGYLGELPLEALDAAVLALGATPQFWKLDDAEGLVFADTGPLGYDMTQSGGVTADFEATGPTSVITKAYKFDGVNNRGTVDDQTEFDPADKFTAMLWVDNGGAAQSARWLFGHYGGGIGWQFMTEATNDIKVRIDNGANIKMYIIPDVMDGDPHHIAFTYGPADVFKVFKDGAEIVSPVKARDDTMTTILHPTGPLNIGRKDTGSWAQFDGAHAIMVQEVATPAEIANIYALSGGA